MHSFHNCPPRTRTLPIANNIWPAFEGNILGDRFYRRSQSSGAPNLKLHSVAAGYACGVRHEGGADGDLGAGVEGAAHVSQHQARLADALQMRSKGAQLPRGFLFRCTSTVPAMRVAGLMGCVLPSVLLLALMMV